MIDDVILKKDCANCNIYQILLLSTIMEIFSSTKTLDLCTRPARHRGEVATCGTLAPVREAGVHPGLPGGGQRRGPGVSAQLQLEVFELRRVDF